MKDLIILGAGENGQMVIDIVDSINETTKKINIIGFLDDDQEKQGKEFLGVPVIGKISDYKSFKNCFFTSPLISSPKTNIIKYKVAKKLNIDPENYLNIIHPRIKIKYLSLGIANLITENCVIFQNTKIGSHCYLSSNVLIGPECSLEDFVNISNSASIQGKTTIKEGAYIGANATIIGNSVIDKWSIVGMGSVVLKNVNAFDVVAGNPARKISENQLATSYFNK